VSVTPFITIFASVAALVAVSASFELMRSIIDPPFFIFGVAVITAPFLLPQILWLFSHYPSWSPILVKAAYM
jgi:hypothetical protein